jgi:hypothetical protein
MTLPIGIILRIYADQCSDGEAATILAIQRGFFSGDYPDDYYCRIERDGEVTAETRARARIALRNSAHQREARRAELESACVEEEEMMAPFAAEMQAVRREEAAHNSRVEALDLDWEGFVLQADTYSQPWPRWMVQWRQRLLHRGAQLFLSGDALSERWANLMARAEAEYSRRAA